MHINRVPIACRVIGMTYHRGKFLNALLEKSTRENEQLHAISPSVPSASPGAGLG
ncbi:MAG: hypothetical protein ACKOBT_02955 [Actinomycetota bacterium]